MSPLLISIAVFIGVTAAVAGATMMFSGGANEKLDDRLNMFTGRGAAKEEAMKLSPLMGALEDRPGIFEMIVSRFSKLSLLFEQADTSLTPSRFFLMTAVLAGGGSVATLIAGWPLYVAPLVALSGAVLPLMYLVFRRRRRLKQFQAQLGSALELISRALRAGHSLGAGFSLVSQEMQKPISTEFGRVFEETNLGVPIEEALGTLTERVPNLDLKFFSTAVVLQRQTGGDLAEILDKISHLIRERFQIWGQVQALTGEGRLSGIVLLALPPALFLAVYRLNPEYMSSLFHDPMGTRMLAGAIVLQLVGALVIKKIINIKVDHVDV